MSNPSSARRGVFPASLTIVALLLSAPLIAIYVQPQIDEVPVERLIGNLEEAARRAPMDADLRLNLARVHAMAYVVRSDQIQTQRAAGNGTTEPWFGFGPPYVPFAGARQRGAQPLTSEEAARAHLRSAIAAYEAALRLRPEDLIARLGYGWCLEQSGNRGGATNAYRTVIAGSPAFDRSRTVHMRATLTEEAAGYLIPLLDPQTDAPEIDRLRLLVNEARSLPRAITPIIVPLGDREVVEALVDERARVRFDADGLARGDTWTWISADAGWLAYDHAGRGQVTSSLQLFGSVSFWMFWRNGYEALRALDDDHDGRLAGEELHRMVIWRDANANAVSEPGEVRPLADWGIVSVSTEYQFEDESNSFTASAPRGVTFRDGSTRPTYDVLLHRVADVP